MASHHHDCLGVSLNIRLSGQKADNLSIVMIGMGFVTGFTSLLVTRILLGMISPIGLPLGVTNGQVSPKLVSFQESLSSSLNGTDVTRSTSELPSSSLPLLPLELSVVFSHDLSTSWME